MVSDALFTAGVDHVLRRSATDRAVAPWIAELVAGRRGALSRVASSSTTTRRFQGRHGSR